MKASAPATRAPTRTRKAQAVAAPRPYHHGDLKNALQRTALALMQERGAEAVSLREISLAAGVSHAAAYRHYADKQALFADLAEQGFRQLVQINHDTIAATAGGPAEQLKACGRAYVRYGVQQPHLLQLMFGGLVTDWQAHAGLAQAGDALAASLADIVRAGQRSGELRRGDVADLTLTAWSLVHGLALLIVGRRIPGARVDEAFVEQASQRCVNLLIEGLQRRPAR